MIAPGSQFRGAQGRFSGMHTFFVAAGIIIVLMIVVHIMFKVIKFTLSVFLLGAALIAIVYVFQQYLGIDLIAAITGYS